MGERRDRDVEKVYSTSEFVAKLRRLADALEAGKRFEIQATCPPGPSSRSSTSGKGRRSNSNSSGLTADSLTSFAACPANVSDSWSKGVWSMDCGK